ncbi:hypothetical protein TanjilG_19527 [Lupinus angustifolius]|uniref:Uncharacterized protein n=1 Tax=Lupinus angustifolius TaxID=3871 RepID=A0A1J7H2B5_LUPAN|nr:hypothetical protein TanjilG_19527 [Lupinus angustifolius]
MTSASELFHTRRYHRFGVLPNADLDLTFHSSTSPNLHHHLRRHHHRSAHTEHAADRLVHRNLRLVVDDSDDSAENGRGISVNVSDRLPVEVLLARERLLERLRGDPVSTYRQHGRDSMVGDQESEVSNDVPTRGSLVTDLTSQIRRRSQLLQELDRKPPGLTQEDINSLYLEVFSSRA